MGLERRPDGIDEYFSCHVDRPAAGDNRPIPTFEEAGRQEFQQGAREVHNAGLFRGLHQGYNRRGQYGVLQGDCNAYFDGYGELGWRGYCGGDQVGACNGDLDHHEDFGEWEHETHRHDFGGYGDLDGDEDVYYGFEDYGPFAMFSGRGGYGGYGSFGDCGGYGSFGDCGGYGYY
ncbi:hypothetical protein TW65_07720 [Stemphylium lycopersici]|nr:hypothetical protein TW65_07720 [Stemphylium lycopersici]